MRVDLIDVIQEFSGSILNPYDTEELLDRVTHHAMAVLDAGGSGIMLEDENGLLAFAAASDDKIIEIERHQQSVREGVCFDAYTQNRLISVEDIAAEGRPWPRYTERVLQAGLRAVIGVPLNAFGRTIGVINVYRQAAGPWTPTDIQSAQILAAIGAGYVVHANELRAQHDLTEHLQIAIDSRDLIGQAKGLLMERHSLDAAAAFGLLRAISQRQNRKLRDVAGSIVDGNAEVDLAVDLAASQPEPRD